MLCLFNKFKPRYCQSNSIPTNIPISTNILACHSCYMLHYESSRIRNSSVTSLSEQFRSLPSVHPSSILSNTSFYRNSFCSLQPSDRAVTTPFPRPAASFNGRLVVLLSRLMFDPDGDATLRDLSAPRVFRICPSTGALAVPDRQVRPTRFLHEPMRTMAMQVTQCQSIQ